MIKDHSRKYWIGASDTKFVMADNRSTKTWNTWWNTKIGIEDSLFSGNMYTMMGNVFEHPILLAINENMNLDRQLKVPKYNLRVNYDGDFDDTIYEVKTHRADREIDYSRGSVYYRQCQVEMFCWKLYLKDSAMYQDYHTREHIPELKGLTHVEYPLNVDEYNKLEAY